MSDLFSAIIEGFFELVVELLVELVSTIVLAWIATIALYICSAYFFSIGHIPFGFAALLSAAVLTYLLR